MTAGQDELLSVGAIYTRPSSPRGHSFDGLVCQSCGEMVIEGYARVAGGKTVCIPCRAALTGS